MLKQAKINTLNERVQECESNMKILYRLVSELTGTKMDNALPKGEVMKTSLNSSEIFSCLKF